MVDQEAVARVKASGGFHFWGLSGEMFTTADGRIITLAEAVRLLDEIERRHKAGDVDE